MTGGAPLAGIVLAGGLARRMGGGDKTLAAIGGRPMLAHIIDRLKPQVGPMALNANGDPARFAAYDLPVVADSVEGFAGPLAGVLAGMDWARASAPECRAIVTVAGDTPFFPRDLAARFADAVAHESGDTICLATSGGHNHPVFGLWPVALADDLRGFLARGETRKVLAWVKAHANVRADFGMVDRGGQVVDPFFNVNTPEDTAQAEKIAAALLEGWA